MSKLQLTDTTFDMFSKMSEGNPGALTVLIELYKKGAVIDPDSAMGGIMNILALDTLEIYGSNIWILFKDTCDQKIENLVLLLRANQLGFISNEEVVALSSDVVRRREPHDFAKLLKQVQDQLPDFGKGYFNVPIAITSK